MRLNPEFRRNLALELTRHRLLAMPGVLLLAFLLAYALAGERAGMLAAGWTALGLFGAITVLWGTLLAAASVLDEFREKTWDTQRLSALDPWTLAWGKLFGGTVFAWYGGAICLPVFLIGTLGGLSPIASVGPPPLAICAMALGAAVLMHALGLLSGLLAPRSGQRRSSVALVLLLIALISGLPLLSDMLTREPVRWWGGRWDAIWFSVIGCWLFAGWAVIGVYRTFCAELQVRTMPGAWIGFAAFLSVYLCGFIVGRADDVPATSLFAAVAFVVTLAMTYASVWVEKRDVISVRRLLLRYRMGDRRRTLEEMPCWLATAPLALLFALYLLIHGAAIPVPGIADRAASAIALAATLLAMRDIALLYFFSFAQNGRSAEMTTLIYLFLLYWLVPGLLSAVGLAPLAHLVLPSFTGDMGFAVAVCAAQAALAGGLALRRWRQRVAAMTLAAA